MTEFDELSKEAGFGDLKVIDRHRNVSVRRQGVFYKMWTDGKGSTEIGRQANRTHATVIHGIKTFGNLLQVNDKDAIDVWARLNSGITILSERIDYWRFIMNFDIADHPGEESKDEHGLYVTKQKEIYHGGELIAQYIPNKL